MPLDMETMEDIKKYIAIAQSLPLESKDLLESKEIEEDASLRQMEAVLAPNCQKLCIGPSFHFYTSEDSADILREKMSQMEDPRSEVDDEEDDEFETVIYNGPDAPYVIVEETNHLQNKAIPPDVKLKLINVRLAQTSAEHGGLLTPHFFLQSPEVSEVVSSSEKVARTSATDSEKRNSKSPFAFSSVSLDRDASESHTNAIAHQLKRVEILDNDPSDEKDPELVEWPNKYIESKGFSLGLQPGNFFKETSQPCFYVKLPHLSKYEVIVANNNQAPCDLDLYVNGQHVAALRLPAGTTRSIDGPQYSDYAFKLFRVKDAPPDKNVTEGSKVNGIVKAVFTPCKTGDSRLRAVSEPLRSVTRRKDFLDIFDEPKDEKKHRSFTIAGTEGDKTERSLDMSRVVEGVTLLQGTKKKKDYVLAPEMETDPSKRVILQLRLIASLDEEVDSTEGEIYNLEPSPLPTRR